jgi:hypothetical protein
MRRIAVTDEGTARVIGMLDDLVSEEGIRVKCKHSDEVPRKPDVRRLSPMDKTIQSCEDAEFV